ncbi:MAG TPA: DUF721 domain-containing protein [Actinobacteria bacterium]|nr:DUF721 domain-containing protein [Actinomycetota bacterium]
MERRDLKPVSDLLPALLAGLGVARLDVMLRLSSEWETLVEDPWKTHAVPQILREGVLVVEAKNGAAVRMLRYGSSGLADHLAEEFGADVIHSVEVVAPGRP